MFACLALLPIDDVEKMHDLMMEKVISYPELQAFDAQYFKPTWMNGLYQIKEWNCHER